MSAAEQMPEGTDQIIDGDEPAIERGQGDYDLTADVAVPHDRSGAGGSAAGSASASGSAGSTAGGSASGDEHPKAFFDRIDDFKAQGFDKARDYAVQGKDRATGALDDLLKMIHDAAGQVDAKIGTQYGDYARRAAETLGGFNDGLKNKDVDELFTDARDLVAKAPAAAAGIAAALGFVVARLAKASIPEGDAGKDGTKSAS